LESGRRAGRAANSQLETTAGREFQGLQAILQPFSVLIESEPGSRFLLTRFLDADRVAIPRIKSEAGFRSETLQSGCRNLTG